MINFTKYIGWAKIFYITKHLGLILDQLRWEDFLLSKSKRYMLNIVKSKRVKSNKMYVNKTKLIGSVILNIFEFSLI